MFVFVLFCFVFVRISVQIFMLFCCYRNTTTPHSRSSILEHMIIYFVFVVLFLWSRRHLDMCIIVNIMSLICFIFLFLHTFISSRCFPAFIDCFSFPVECGWCTGWVFVATICYYEMTYSWWIMTFEFIILNATAGC